MWNSGRARTNRSSGVHRQASAHRLGRRQQVGVAQDRTLRGARRAGRVDEQRRVVARWRRRAPRRAPGRAGSPLRSGGVTTAPGAAAAIHRPRSASSVTAGGDRGVAHDVADLGLAVRPVQRHGHGAEPQHADVGDHVVERGLGRHHHPVAGADPGRPRGGPRPAADRSSSVRGCQRGAGRIGEEHAVAGRRPSAAATRPPATRRAPGRRRRARLPGGRWSVHGRTTASRSSGGSAHGGAHCAPTRGADATRPRDRRFNALVPVRVLPDHRRRRHTRIRELHHGT